MPFDRLTRSRWRLPAPGALLEGLSLLPWMRPGGKELATCSAEVEQPINQKAAA